MTSQRTLTLRILTVSFLFIAVLGAVIALAAPQQASTQQRSAPASAASAPVQVSPEQSRVHPPVADKPQPPSNAVLHGQKSAAAAPNSGSPFVLVPVIYDAGAPCANSVAVADVNGDGKPDLLLAFGCMAEFGGAAGFVGVMLGNGDGTFQAAVIYSSGGVNAASVAVADVNGDGKLDLVVANGCANGTDCSPEGVVGVLLGNGDGTFQPALTFNSGGSGLYGSYIAVADVNGDGKPDLLVASTEGESNYDGSVGVLLGNGDGTFQPAVSYSTGTPTLTALAVADVNGDGKPDVVVANWASESNGDGSVGVLLGNGDGTFQPIVTYDSGGPDATGVAVADMNGDGKPDLEVANGGSNGDSSVGVLLGNGDGTFQPVVTHSSAGMSTRALAVGDINSDGKPDLVVADCSYPGGGSCPNSVAALGVLLGNGDGTVQEPKTFNFAGGSPTSIAIADVNGDGRLDVVVTNLAGASNGGTVVVLLNTSNNNRIPTSTSLTSSTNPSALGQAVTFTATVTSDDGGIPNGEPVAFYEASTLIGTGATASGVATFMSSSLTLGTHTIKAAYAGDVTFLASSNKIAQVVNRYATSTTLVSSLNPSIYGQSITWTATVTPLGSIVPTGTVNFNWGGTHTFGTAALNSSGVATLTRSTENADTYAMTAVYSGDANNGGSTSTILNQVIQQATSTATLTSSPNPSALGQAVTFTATINSPTTSPTGPVTFTAENTVLGTVQLKGRVAKFTTSTLAVGSTTVTATYAGDSNITGSSASVTQTVQQ